MARKNMKLATDPQFVAKLDERIARMRELLRLMAPETGSAALGAIRRAFPEAPLRDRVQALKEHVG